jgi:hypothetical protein
VLDLKGQTSETQDQSVYLHHKAHAAIVYLWGLPRHHPQPESKWIWGMAGAPEEVFEVVRAINTAFEHSYRRDHARQYVSDYFPTARDRLECRQWLADLFLTMNLDMSILDRAFPPT